MSEPKQTESKRVIPQLSVDAQLLARHLEKVQVGEVIEYAALNKIINANVQNGARSILAAARKKVLNDERIVFDVIMGKGLKRLNDSEIIGTGTCALARIRRTSRRAVKKLACAEYDKLPTGEQTKFNAVASMLGALNQAAKDSNLRSLETKVAEARSQISFNATLDLFKK